MQFYVGGRSGDNNNLLTDASTQGRVSSVGVQTNFEEKEVAVEEGGVKEAARKAYEGFKVFINMQENKGLKLVLIVLVGCIIAMFWYLQMQVNLRGNEPNLICQHRFNLSHHVCLE